MVFQLKTRDTVPVGQYMACAFTYLTAMVSSTMSLRHVNYPTQVIGKSCKPIPVMILGVLYAKKSYPLRKYFFIILVVAGVALFVWKDSASARTNESSGYMGYLLLMLSLAMDGFTGGIQDRMRTEHQPGFSQLMFNMNFWSSWILATTLLATGELWQFVDFVQRHPKILNDMVAFSALSAFGQLFIFLIVADFGPLPCSIVTTTRKFFTVLTSILYFGNPATYRQYIGVVLVFTGLALDSIKGKEKKALSVKTAEEDTEPLIFSDKIKGDHR